jgi:hypothetical protein
LYTFYDDKEWNHRDSLFQFCCPLSPTLP